jgi:hypothetical protein
MARNLQRGLAGGAGHLECNPCRLLREGIELPPAEELEEEQTPATNPATPNEPLEKSAETAATAPSPTELPPPSSLTASATAFPQSQ